MDLFTFALGAVIGYPLLYVVFTLAVFAAPVILFAKFFAKFLAHPLMTFLLLPCVPIHYFISHRHDKSAEVKRMKIVAIVLLVLAIVLYIISQNLSGFIGSLYTLSLMWAVYLHRKVYKKIPRLKPLYYIGLLGIVLVTLIIVFVE